MYTEPQIYFQREAGGWTTTAALLTRSKEMAQLGFASLLSSS